MRILPIIGVAAGSALLIFVGAGAAYWYGKQTAVVPVEAAEKDPVEPPRTEQAAEPARSGASAIEIDMLRQLLTLVDAERREAILASPEVFAQFVEQERASQAVLTAAYANAADRNDAVAALMLRASQKVLAEAYLTQVVRRNLDAGFPTEAQTREFYDANLASFKLPDRVHLWQIFIPADENSSKQAEINAKALAEQISKSLIQGKTTFAAAAEKYSKHLQSRVNDGYMGLLKLDDLLPEVRAAVDKLKPDAVSAPIRSATGFHIIKRGAIVAGTQLEYSAVHDRIVAQLRREAANRVRQAAVKKILETYPVAVDEAAIDAWLQELRTDEWPTTAREPSPTAAQQSPPAAPKPEKKP